MKSQQPLRWVPLLVLTILAISHTAIAQQAVPTEQAKAAARALASKGLEHFNAGRYDEALAALREVEAQVHAPAILIFAARSCERLGRLLETPSLDQRIVDQPLTASSSARSSKGASSILTKFIQFDDAFRRTR